MARKYFKEISGKNSKIDKSNVCLSKAGKRKAPQKKRWTGVTEKDAKYRLEYNLEVED